MHLPINHRLAGLYRFLAALVGIYLLIFGIVGVVATRGQELFARGDMTALGLRINLGFAILSIVVGAIVLLGAFIGGNLAHYLYVFGGGVFWAAGLLMLLLLQTEANILNFQVSTCVVSFLIGTVLVLAGLYGKRGSREAELAEDAFRHSGRGPVAEHIITPGHHIAAHPGVEHIEE